MSEIEAHGLTVDVPPGWEGRVYRRAQAGELRPNNVAGAPAPPGELTFPVVLGAFRRRNAVVVKVNAVLASIRIDPLAAT